MKIVIVTTEYTTGSMGGVASVVNFLIAAIRRLTDWDMEVASLRMSRRAVESRRLLAPRSWVRSARTSTREVDGVTVHNVGSALGEVEASRFMPRPWLDLVLEGADVVVVVSGTPALCNAVRNVSVPVVLQVATLVKFERMGQNAVLHGPQSLYRRLTTRLTGRLDEAGLTIPGQILVENNLMLAECEQRGLNQVSLCPPGVDTEFFVPNASKQNKPYILMVARLSDARKNVSGLVEAYAEARAEHGLTQDLILAGASQPDPETLLLIQNLGMASFIRIHSPVAQGELLSLYQGADLFVSASLEEGLGLTFLEAMSCGIPVIASNTAGATFVMGPALAGALVAHGPGFTNRFALEIARWCSDSELRAAGGSVARARVVGVFSEQIAAQQFVDVIAKAGINHGQL